MTQRALFLCTGNSCRSLMAQYLLVALSEGEWQADSAGSHPSGQPHPLALQVLSEIGIDASDATSDPMTPYLDQDYDIVVTVCDNAKESCPVFPGAKRLEHWPFQDPAEAGGSTEDKLAVFRRVRDEIRERLLEFLNDAHSQG